MSKVLYKMFSSLQPLSQLLLKWIDTEKLCINKVAFYIFRCKSFFERLSGRRHVGQCSPVQVPLSAAEFSFGFVDYLVITHSGLFTSSPQEGSLSVLSARVLGGGAAICEPARRVCLAPFFSRSPARKSRLHRQELARIAH